MKNYLRFFLLLFLIITCWISVVSAEEKNFCKTGQKYYFDSCRDVATQCTYNKSDGGIAYININTKGEAKAAEENNGGNEIKNWKDSYDDVPTVDKKYSENKQCPPILIEYWGFYVVDTQEKLDIAKEKLNNPAKIFVLSNSTYNTLTKNDGDNESGSESSSSSSAPDADSCATLTKYGKDACVQGHTAKNGNFGCAWNKKYEFCSPNGLVYLSCGDSNEKNEIAHDIPEMVPRLVSYFIIILKTATPIILIIMGMVQIIKAIANSNEDEIKKAKSSLIKKLIAAVLVFFSISIVQFVVDQVVDNDEKGSLGACLNCFINNNCGDTTYFVDGYGKCYYLSDKTTGVDCDTDIGGKVNNEFLPSDGSPHGSSGVF